MRRTRLSRRVRVETMSDARDFINALVAPGFRAG